MEVDQLRPLGLWETNHRVQTRVTDGRPAFLVDPGSIGNLCGDAWAKSVAVAASRHGQIRLTEEGVASAGRKESEMVLKFALAAAPCPRPRSTRTVVQF